MSNRFWLVFKVCPVVVVIVVHASSTLCGFADDAKDLPDLGTRKQGDDWPQFLGPTADSKSAEIGIRPWPAEGPKQVWVRPLNESYSIGSVSRGRYYQFDHADNEARLLCLNSETGAEIWTFEYASNYRDLYGYNSGPRCSPVIDGNRVYIYGVAGLMHCLNAKTGELIWKEDLNRRFGVVQNFFGVGSTPVIHDEVLITMVGGSPPESQRIPPGQLDRVTANGTAVVALDKRTGKVRYTVGNDLASYASPRIVNHNERPWCFMFLRSGLLAFNPDNGQTDFEFPWRARILESVNASCPVIVGNQAFITETYGPGSALLSFQPGNYQIAWQDNPRRREKSMKAHWNTPIYHDGYLYGCSGRHTHDADLRCVDFKTGEVMWRKGDVTRTSLLYVDGHLIGLSEDGTLRLFKANPQRFELVSQVRPALRGPGGEPGRPLLRYPAWSAPILAHGLLYVRGADRLACLEVIPTQSQ